MKMTTTNVPNPFHAAHDTSLSSLSDHDWQVLRSRWHKGIDWNVGKLGRFWQVTGDCFKGAPLFKTKKAAFDYASNLILAESHWRAHQEWEANRLRERG
jgi:hypothetical protein